MDKTIEAKFFEAFDVGGVVDKCIDYIRHTYNLPPVNPRASTKEREETPEQRKIKENKYYRETLPKEILEATEAFEFDAEPLMDEIEANLNECQTDAQRERYLFSLLMPFREVARVCTPIAELNRLKKRIEKYERHKALLQSLPENEQLKNVSGKSFGTPKELIEVLNSLIKGEKEQIDWVEYVEDRFGYLTSYDFIMTKEGKSVEGCFFELYLDIMEYVDRLDALLLTYGIDLLRLQRESGVYLKSHRMISDVDSYIGSRELAQRYIDALPKEPQPEQANNRQTTDAQSLKPEPQQEQPKKTRGRGRPIVSLKDKMIDDTDGSKLQKMHAKIDGKKGKDATLIILACIKKGWLTRPTYNQVKNEFGEIGSKTGFNRYLYEQRFTKEEIEGAINSLD